MDIYLLKPYEREFKMWVSSAADPEFGEIESGVLRDCDPIEAKHLLEEGIGVEVYAWAIVVSEWASASQNEDTHWPERVVGPFASESAASAWADARDWRGEESSHILPMFESQHERHNDSTPARPDGWRCLCEGDHDQGCPWGPYLAALDEQEADRAA